MSFKVQMDVSNTPRTPVEGDKVVDYHVNEYNFMIRCVNSKGNYKLYFVKNTETDCMDYSKMFCEYIKKNNLLSTVRQLIKFEQGNFNNKDKTDVYLYDNIPKYDEQVNILKSRDRQIPTPTFSQLIYQLDRDIGKEFIKVIEKKPEAVRQQVRTVITTRTITWNAARDLISKEPHESVMDEECNAELAAAQKNYEEEKEKLNIEFNERLKHLKDTHEAVRNSIVKKYIESAEKKEEEKKKEKTTVRLKEIKEKLDELERERKELEQE